MGRSARADGLPSLPEALDLERDDVAVVQPTRKRFQRRRIEVLDQRAGGHRPGADDVAGREGDAARGVGDDFAEGPVHLGGRSGADDDIVDQCGDPKVQPAVPPIRLELVGGHQVGAQRDPAVFALALPDPQLAFHLLQIACGPVVEDGVPDDRPFGLFDGEVLPAGSDHRGDLQFEVLPRASGCRRGVVVGAQNCCRASEVKRGDPVPGVTEYPAGAQRGLAVAHVVKEAQGIPDRRRARDRRQQPHRRQRDDPRRGTLCILARSPQSLGTTRDEIEERHARRHRMDRVTGEDADAFAG